MDKPTLPPEGTPRTPTRAGLVGRIFLATYRTARRGRNKLFSWTIAPSFGCFGSHSVLDLPIAVDGEREIFIGKDVWIGWRSRLCAASGTDAHIRIGDNCKAAGALTIEARASVTIEEAVLFASNITLTTRTYLAAPPFERPIHIGAGSWLGQNVVVHGGLRIGQGAVIGANAVVTTDIPDHAVAVGAPARITPRHA